MAGGAFVDPETAKRAQHYEYNITRAFILSCMIGAIGGSLFGYDLGVSGGVTSMDDFLLRFFPKVYERKLAYKNETDSCKYDNQVLTLFTSSLYFAGLISTFAASYVTEKRKESQHYMWFHKLPPRINCQCSRAKYCHVDHRAHPPRCRNRVRKPGSPSISIRDCTTKDPRRRQSIVFRLTTRLGIMVANLVNYFTEKLHPWGWRLSLGLAAVPAILMFIGGVFLPETPNSLVEQGRMEEGRRNLERIRGTKNVDAEFADLIDASNAARAVKHPFRNLLERRNRPQLVIGALGIPAFQQLTGMNSILFYAPVIFQSLGFGNRASLYSSLITSSILVLATLVSMYLVDRLGRRFFFLEASAQMILSMVVVVNVLALKFGHGVVLEKGYAVTLVIAICTFVAAYGWSWGPLGWLVPSELFPLEMRSAGQSVVVCVNLFFTAAVAQFFLISLSHLKYGIFILFGGLILIMATFIFFLLPETKQVPIEEAVPLYLSEIAPPKIRGAVNQLFQLTICLGIMVANQVNYFTEKLHPWGWRLSLGLAAVPAILMYIGGVFLPEMPNSLVEQGRMEERKRNLERIRGTKM
ncbi:hypothetical protein Sjap_019609 [Stephania japonica]|uniref:Major facilitator superfamily (MFS) profile domain-containing protein n=1 Tax=Stephania japonica TaxID=461633 RepID=A0AAP0EZ39_9MAGN